MKERFLAAPGRKPAAVIVCIAVLAISLIAGCWWGITAALDPYDCRMAPGVTIGGLDVGGMTRLEARSALKDALESSLYAKNLSVLLPGETLTLSPAETGVRVNVGKAIKAAYSFGRGDAWESPEIPLLPFLKLKEEDVRSLLHAVARRIHTDVTQPSWELTGTQPNLSTDAFDPALPGQVLRLTMGIPTLRLNVDQVYDEILITYAQAIPLCAAGSFSTEPEVMPEVLPELPDLDAIYEEIAVQSEDDSLDMEEYRFVAGSYGYGFDPEQARPLVEAAAFGETLEIPLVHTEPEILGEEVYFRDVLGSCETRHTDDENRNTNLRLLCQALDGVVLQPGEEFSYNGTVGERTEEKGYKPANAYSGTRLVKDVGGGVCQGSTTLYNCALLADVEILERVCHGAKVGYVPLGLDAAVNWNTKTDLRFKNNFHFPMMIKAEVADGYVKMQILGTDEKDYYIEMRCGVGDERGVTYAVSYKCKYDKETGEQISKDLEARSTYYTLDS